MPTYSLNSTQLNAYVPPPMKNKIMKVNVASPF